MRMAQPTSLKRDMLKLQTETLWRALAFVTPFASVDASRLHLRGPTIHTFQDNVGQRVVAYATNSHCVAFYERTERDHRPYKRGSEQSADLCTATAKTFVKALRKPAADARRERVKETPRAPTASILRAGESLQLWVGKKPPLMISDGPQRSESLPPLNRVWPYSTLPNDAVSRIQLDPGYGALAFRCFNLLKIHSVEWAHTSNEYCPLVITASETENHNRYDAPMMPEERCAILIMPKRRGSPPVSFPFPILAPIAAAEAAV